MSDIIYTMGVDVGGSYIKSVLVSYNKETGDHKVLDKQTEKIRKRNPKVVATEIVSTILERNNLDYDKDIAYLSSTGEGEMVERKTGHFYSMTSHSRGGKHFFPNAKTLG